MNDNIRISAVILASGMSKRMGTTKQLLMFQGVPLLEYTIRKLLFFPFIKIYAIIGHNSNEIMNLIDIKDQRFEWIFNNMYQEGQSAALQKAIRTIEDVDGMMVFLADQPLILDETIRQVFNEAATRMKKQEPKCVVQPSFSGKKGHPVFFSSTLFPFFKMLQGDEGGKRIINHSRNHHIIPVGDPGILFDIDTPEDYQILLSKDSSVPFPE
ncbi:MULTISPECIES: NTP transferase domain-containing protein [unclassified Peribacillus]|uniref:nucleotidyltransferase family protein n=1 Tax=unclassified Peribacillus TaxID=2675266 RepID=UPI001E59D9D5|nr:nucleotidyltransferase family protein [Peribacillus sp. Bi96]